MRCACRPRSPAARHDLFGPKLRSRQGWQLGLGHDVPLIDDAPRKLDLVLDAQRYGRLDTLPVSQNADTEIRTLTELSAELRWRELRRWLGAVDHECGVAADTRLTPSRAGGRWTPQWQTGLDLGRPLPWRHAALWWRGDVGVGGGRREDLLGDFYFGGFGNNRVDRGEAQRYREPGSLPGFGLDALVARRYVRQQVELLLPRRLFDATGVPDLHATWLRPQVFATALWTDPGRPEAQRRASIGAQLDLRLGVPHGFEMLVSVGAATGFGPDRRPGGEWMLSPRVM